MWALGLIPTEILQWAIHAIVAIGLITFIISFFIPIYGKILSPIAIVVLLFGVYCEGGYLVEKEWRLKVSDMQKKVAEAEEKSAIINTVIQTKIVEKIKVIKETTDGNTKYIDRVVTQYDNKCELPSVVVRVHNAASQNILAASTGVVDERASDVKISELLRTVTENYGIYYQTREQVMGWQMWYNEQKKIYESVK
jgi:hypothetical protein